MRGQGDVFAAIVLVGAALLVVRIILAVLGIWPL